MLIFKFSDRQVRVPDRWEEVTVQHFVTEGFLGGNPILLLSVLSGIEPSLLANTTVDLTPKYAKIVQFMIDDPNGWKGDKATEIEILGVMCKIPKNIEMEMFGQKIMMGDSLNRNVDNIFNALPEVLAIYLAPQIYPDDWYRRIEEVSKHILTLPINKVYPIAGFFLTLIK